MLQQVLFQIIISIFPVYKNIDYYIAQSEYFKESCRGTTVYDKMLPLGSPKIDNVIYKCEMKNNVSEQWKKDSCR